MKLPNRAATLVVDGEGLSKENSEVGSLHDEGAEKLPSTGAVKRKTGLSVR